MGIAADISLIVVFALILGAIAHRLGQPLLLGSIAAGVLLGPHTGGISIQDPHEIELLAEVGIALLLFSIGTEFSFSALLSVRRVAVAGTAIQLALTGVLGWSLGPWLGLDPIGSVWLGALISVSSTMVVLKTLTGSRFMGTLSSRVMLGMLIAQDIAVIPLMIVLPQLSTPSIDLVAIALAVGRSALLLVFLVVGGRRVIPWLMHRIVAWGSRELFVLSVVTLGLGIGYLSHLLGLSFALGAFVAGLVLSESEYAHQALSDVIPLRDLFGVLFFASVGMLLDPRFLLDEAGSVALLVVTVLVGKAVIFAVVTRTFGYRKIVPIAVALTMAQIGEFSFLLAQMGRQVGAVGDHLHGLVVSTTVITMVLTPYLARMSTPLYRWRRRNLPSPGPATFAGVDPVPRPVVIAGAGRVGRRIAQVLARHQVGMVLIDFDQGRMLKARAEGWPVVFGDAAQDPVLTAAGITEARLAIVTVPAAVDSWAVASRIRALTPEVPLIVRTDTFEGIEPLLRLGALNVVLPEFEASMEMAREALVALGVDADTASHSILQERAERFGPPLPGS